MNHSYKKFGIKIVNFEIFVLLKSMDVFLRGHF
jgi:hypothetical protein